MADVAASVLAKLRNKANVPAQGAYDIFGDQSSDTLRWIQ